MPTWLTSIYSNHQNISSSIAHLRQSYPYGLHHTCYGTDQNSLLEHKIFTDTAAVDIDTDPVRINLRYLILQRSPRILVWAVGLGRILEVDKNQPGRLFHPTADWATKRPTTSSQKGVPLSHPNSMKSKLKSLSAAEHVLAHKGRGRSREHGKVERRVGQTTGGNQWRMRAWERGWNSLSGRLKTLGWRIPKKNFASLVFMICAGCPPPPPQPFMRRQKNQNQKPHTGHWQTILQINRKNL